MPVKNKKVSFTLLLMVMSFIAKASGEVEMADRMRADGKIYVVVAVMAIVFTGLGIYLFMLDKKVTKLEKAIKEKQN